MSQATEAVFSYDEHWQSHFHCQISDKIIRADRNHPTSNPFDENIVNPRSQRLIRAEQGLDVVLQIFNLSGGPSRGCWIYPQHSHQIISQSVHVHVYLTVLSYL